MTSKIIGEDVMTREEVNAREITKVEEELDNILNDQDRLLVQYYANLLELRTIYREEEVLTNE